MHRSLTLTLTGLAFGGASLLVAGPASAHECVNASRDAHSPGAGAQIILGPNDEIEWATPGVMQRVANGQIDPETGEGFNGLIGIDLDGDGVPEFTTYIVDPDDELPDQAQQNGSPDHGIVNVCDVIDCNAP